MANSSGTNFVIIWGIRVMRANFFKRMSSSRGSVLMEFVLVLPVYMAVIGGILWLGMKSLDAINLRAADHWGVWMAGNRFSMRLPAITALQSMFPRTTLITTSQERVLTGEHSFLQFIGSKTTLYETRPEFLDNWINMPYTARGESKPFSIPEFQLTSSRYGNKYTQCIIMRTKGSDTDKRHWDSSLVAKHNVWKFESKDDEYPKEWKLELLDDPKYKDDTKEQEKEPKKIDFYTRYSKYEQWSTKK